MKIQDALQIFGLSGDITAETVKSQYRKLCKQYHPDRNPAGLQMMQAVNAAYDCLKNGLNEGWTINPKETNNVNFGEELNAAIGAVINLDGISIEVCGAWVWVTGDTKPHKDVIKAAGFKFARKKCAWYFKPSNSFSKGRGKFSLDDIRDMHGSESVAKQSRKTQALPA